MSSEAIHLVPGEIGEGPDNLCLSGHRRFLIDVWLQRENRCQHTIDIGHRLVLVQERVDLIDHAVDIPVHRQIVDAVKLHVPCPWNVCRKIAAVLGWCRAVASPVQYEGWNPH